MRLADPENAEAIADCKSIREADVKLRQSGNGSCGSTTAADDQTTDDDETADDDADDQGDDAQRVVQRTAASPDLATTFKNTAVDEVYSALTQVWDRDHIRDLANRLMKYVSPPPTDLPTALQRRPLTPSTAKPKLKHD
jgi:hypothetical protein